MTQSRYYVFGGRLRALRVASGVPSEQVAQEVGVGRAGYLHWETGHNLPRLQRWGALMRALRASPADEQSLLDALDLAELDKERGRFQFVRP